MDNLQSMIDNFYKDEAGVYGQIKSDILAWNLPPGTRISEQKLAKKFGISKSPVREALQRLLLEQILEVRPRSGYRVRTISLVEVKEIYEVRQIYEQTIVRLAIKNASNKMISSFRQMNKFKKNINLDEWITINRKFHIGLACLCGNARFASIVSEFIWQFDRFTYLSARLLDEPEDYQPFFAEHSDIIEAIEIRDTRKAQNLIQRHINDSEQRIVEMLESFWSTN